MEKHATVRQYTIRNVPDEVDAILKNRALSSGKSFNQVVLDALQASCGVEKRRDLSWFAGTLTADEADRQDAEIASQHRVDAKMWLDSSPEGQREVDEAGD